MGLGHKRPALPSAGYSNHLSIPKLTPGARPWARQ